MTEGRLYSFPDWLQCRVCKLYLDESSAAVPVAGRMDGYPTDQLSVWKQF